MVGVLPGFIHYPNVTIPGPWRVWVRIDYLDVRAWVWVPFLVFGPGPGIETLSLVQITDLLFQSSYVVWHAALPNPPGPRWIVGYTEEAGAYRCRRAPGKKPEWQTAKKIYKKDGRKDFDMMTAVFQGDTGRVEYDLPMCLIRDFERKNSTTKKPGEARQDKYLS